MKDIKTQLDLFIKKFYWNQMIRGGLWALLFLISFGLLLIGVEYFFYLPAWLKIPLVSVYLLLSLYLVIKGFGIPWLKRMGVLPRMTYKDAALLIGTHFKEIQDRLLNLLELEEATEVGAEHPLILASITQRTEQLRVFSFPKAINLSANKKYIKWLIPGFLILLLVAWLAPQVLKDTSYRWVNAQQNFDPPAPFTFNINEKGLKVARNSDVLLDVHLEGGHWTEAFYLVVEGKKYEMQAMKSNWFQYKWSQVQGPFEFYFQAGRYKSAVYQVEVFDRAQTLSMEMELNYPVYTQLKTQTLNGLSDVQVPEGTQVIWKIKTAHVSTLEVVWDEHQKEVLTPNSDHSFEWKKQLFEATDYELLLKNKEDPEGITLAYEIKVIKDEAPQIQMQRMSHEKDERQLVLSGAVSDDYGLTALSFIYQILDSKGEIKKTERIALPFKQGASAAYFEHYIDISTWAMKVGEKAQYFIEARDNDAINGPKTTRSEVYVFEMPLASELDGKIQEHAEKVQQGMDQTMKQSQQMEEMFERAKTDLLQSKQSNWDQQQTIRELMETQQQMLEQLKQTQEDLERQLEDQALKEEDSPLDEKREALAKQLDELKNKELEEQLKKLQELLKEQNKSKALDAVQKIQEQNKLFQMDMERIQSLIERLNMQKALEEMAKELEALAKKQKATAEKTTDQAQEQQKVKDAFEKLKEELDKDVFPKNDQMKQPLGLDDIAEDAEDLKKMLDELQEKMDASPSSPSNKKQQQDAGQKMQDMAQKMQEQAAGLDMKQIDIDLKAVRQLLTNLIRYSFEQEALMESERHTPVGSPAFAKHAQKQQELNRNARMMSDSLAALSQRIMELGPSIQRETHQWIQRTDNAVHKLVQRNVQQARIDQRYAMSHANNMANTLEEMMGQLMQMQAMGMPAQGEGGEDGMPAPGQGGKSGEGLQDIITGQEQLGQDMPGSKDGGEQSGEGQGTSGESGKDSKEGQNGEGEGQGDGQDGEGEGDQSGGNAEQIAKWIHAQQQLRAKVKSMEDRARSQGQGNSPFAKLLREIQEAMNKQEEDVLFGRSNKKQRMHTQQEIMQRLLEADKAMREQDESEQRRADLAKEVKARPMPAELDEYLKQQQRKYQMDVPEDLPLRKPYKEMAERYLRNLK